jgi:hypothetical protein
MHCFPIFCKICSAGPERRLLLIWMQRHGRVMSIIASNQASWSTRCSRSNICGSMVSSSVFVIDTRSCRLACESVAVRPVYSNDTAHCEMTVILEKSCSNAVDCAPWILPGRVRGSGTLQSCSEIEDGLPVATLRKPSSDRRLHHLRESISALPGYGVSSWLLMCNLSAIPRRTAMPMVSQALSTWWFVR